VTVTSTDLVHLGRSDLGVSPPSDDLRGMVVVDPSGLRIGEVDDVLIEVRDRSARLISVVSGGVFGVAVRRTLIPVETITREGSLQSEVAGMQTRARLYELLDYEAYNAFDTSVFNFQVPGTR